jgi:hypothetical membrane protein
MHEMIAAGGTGAPSAASEKTTTTLTRALLASGVIAGPLFYVMVGIQALTRPGFDIRRHPLSLLSLGDLGWIQTATFVAAGLGGVACAAGIRRALRPGRGATWGPVMVWLWGLGLIAAGIFTADPAFGFPPGAPQGVQDHLSWHAVLHGAAFFTTFVSLVVACVVFARRFAGVKRWGWVAYCLATAVVGPAIVAVGMSNTAAAGVPFALAGAVAFGWVSVLALQLLSGLGSRRARTR